MNKLQEQIETINENRKKYVSFENAIEIPLGVSAIKDDGSFKGRIESVDTKYVYVTCTTKDYLKITFKELYKNWLLELQPGNYMVAGKPDDSGIIVP